LNELQVLILPIVACVLVFLLGWIVAIRRQRRRLAGRSLLIGIDRKRGDAELRYVKPVGNRLVWGVEKKRAGVLPFEGVVTPGDGTALNLVAPLPPSLKHRLAEWLLGYAVEARSVDVQEKTSLTLNSVGRAFIVDRDTLQTMRVSAKGSEIETAPEDGWQVGMYAAGVHERNIARPPGGSWLEELARYTPLIVIVVGVILVGAIAAVAAKVH